MSFLKRLFGGGSTAPPPYSPDAADPIASFWRWWGDAAGPLHRAIQKGALDPWVEPISAAVRAIDDGLAWELGPGGRCHHHLAVSSEGDPTLRLVAERWLAQAPPADLTWEFHAAKQGSGDASGSLQLADTTFHFQDFRFALHPDEGRAVVHVKAFHPAFGGVEQDVALHAVFICLDQMLGEDRMSKFVGLVEVSHEPLSDGLPPADLATVVTHLERLDPTEWTAGRGEREGRPLVFVAAWRAKRLDHLGLDVLATVRIPFANPDEDGLPADGNTDAIDEVFLELPLDEGTPSLYLGRALHEGHRVVHLRFASGAPGLNALADWAAAETRWDVELTTTLDPDWSAHPDWIA